MGGTQSLHTNSMDETLALPSEKAAEIALRTQQLIAYETGVANVVDPLGGSWYVESLTDKLEAEAEDYFRKVDEMGGVISAIEDGYFQREIARSAFEYEKKINEKSRIVVGVNDFIKEDEKIEIPILEIGTDVEENQNASLVKLREERDSQAVAAALANVEASASSEQNLLPPIIEAAHAGASLGEIVTAMKKVFGEWNETPAF